jgi:hypothetical protein
MSERPDLSVMWRLAFDTERHRLRPDVRTSVLVEDRCTRRGRHLRAVVLRSAFGPWVAWRPAGMPRDVWQQAWLASDPIVDATCHCGQVARVVLPEANAMP